MKIREPYENVIVLSNPSINLTKIGAAENKLKLFLCAVRAVGLLRCQMLCKDTIAAQDDR